MSNAIKEAQALLDMGARMVDASTVKALIEEVEATATQPLPDKLLTIEGCIETFGLNDNVWRQACKKGRLPCTEPHGGVGYMIRFEDAHGFARRWFEEHKLAVPAA